MTHTYALLDVNESTFKEIADKLKAAGYGHAFHDDGTVIDMHGIGLQADGATPETFGWQLGMRVMQSDLYGKLDPLERSICDELVRRNPYMAKPLTPPAESAPQVLSAKTIRQANKEFRDKYVYSSGAGGCYIKKEANEITATPPSESATIPEDRVIELARHAGARWSVTHSAWTFRNKGALAEFAAILIREAELQALKHQSSINPT